MRALEGHLARMKAHRWCSVFTDMAHFWYAPTARCFAPPQSVLRSTFAIPPASENLMAKPTNTVNVVSVHHYTDRLFKFRVTRPRAFRFKCGQFVMIGLKVDGEPLMRAYSMASPAWDEELEFFSIKVPNGPLSRLQHIKVDDEILIAEKAVGSLVVDSLKPGKRLFMFATGTGIAPFASIMRDPLTYERFDEVYLTHTCRLVAELEYGKELAADHDDPSAVKRRARSSRHFTSVTQRTTPIRGASQTSSRTASSTSTWASPSSRPCARSAR